MNRRMKWTRQRLSPPVRRYCSLTLVAGVLVLSSGSTPSADEMDTLPPAPPNPVPQPKPVQPQSTQSQFTSIKSVIPPYIDQGVMMVPMRPLCDFLGASITYLDSIISVSHVASEKESAANSVTTTTITLRTGGETAQIQKGTERKTVKLPLPAEARLGTTFLPLRFFTDAFGATVKTVNQGENHAVEINAVDRTGVLQTGLQAAYRGGDAARVTIFNGVGHALSIRLTGPQNLAVELGRQQGITYSLRPGVYYYRAASAGMKTVKGVRRFLAGHKATWAWGRRT